MSRPAFWIVAGPNGSGKSTLIRSGLLERWTGAGLRALSPDDLVPALRLEHPGESELALVRRAQASSDAAVTTAIAAGRTLMVETVLSSRKFEPTVAAALAQGSDFGFIYVVVASAELNIDRVADRVEEGGHDVTEDLIRSRRVRSLAAVGWFAERASLGAIIDNSGQRVRVLAEKGREAPAWQIVEPLALATLGITLPA